MDKFYIGTNELVENIMEKRKKKKRKCIYCQYLLVFAQV